MKNPDMIIFDYGGTLLHEPGFDLLRGERAVFKHVMKNPRHYTAEQSCQFGKELFQKLEASREHGGEVHEWQLLRLQYEYLEMELDVSYEEAERILWENTSPMSEEARMPHIEELLSYLNKNGIRSGVISNLTWSGKALKRRIDTLLPENRFEFIIASSEYGIRKPEKMIFDLALKKAKLSADQVWFCGDTFETDIKGAAGAGIFPVLYEGEAEDLFRGSVSIKNEKIDHLCISDWRELIAILEEGQRKPEC